MSQEIDGSEVDVGSPSNFVLSPNGSGRSMNKEVVANPTVLDDGQRGKRKRVRYSSTKLRGIVTNTIRKVSSSPSTSSPTSSQTLGTSYLIEHFVNCDRFSMGHRKFLVANTTGTEPQTFKIAMKDPGWQQAMQKEI